MNNSFSNNIYTICVLAKRSLKIFLKDKATVFFSLLAPLIILGLYVLFLGDIQADIVRDFFPEEYPVNEKVIRAFIDSWMLAGVMGVACITVSLSANGTMVADKQRGIINDCMASPVKKWVVNVSYYVCNIVITLVICMFVLGICFLYLAVTKEFYLSFKDVMELILITILSVLSASVITVFIASFVKTESALSAIGGIASALVGFVLGAYMPMSIMPKAVQYFSGALPGSHAAGLFRNIFMNKTLDILAGDVTEIRTGMEETYCLNINVFGKNVGTTGMYIIVIGSIFLFILIKVIIDLINKEQKSK